MKKPKRFLTSGEFSQIIMKLCLFFGSICMISAIASAETLELKFKIIDIVILVAIIIGVAVDFVFKYISFRNSAKNSEENEVENEVTDDEGEE